MPKWIHDRAMSLKKDMKKTYGPEKAEQVAFAVATQQAHRLGKSPKTFKSKVTGKKETFGTPVGRAIAKEKFDKPKKEYQKTASLRRAAEELKGLMVISKSANEQMGYSYPQAPTSGMQGPKMLPTPPPTAQGAAHMMPGMAAAPVGSRPAPTPPPVVKVGADITAFTDELLSIWGQPSLEKDAGFFRQVGDTTEAVAREAIKGAKADAYFKYVYGGASKRAKKELAKQLKQRLPGLTKKVEKIKKSPTYIAIAEEMARSGDRAHKVGMKALS